MSLTKMVDKVQAVLNDDEKARDNDFRLECIINSKYFKLEKVNVLEFYHKLNSSKLPSPASIRRARRKCQELYPNTRGCKYLHRMEKQKMVKDELNEARTKASNPSWY